MREVQDKMDLILTEGLSCTQVMAWQTIELDNFFVLFLKYYCNQKCRIIQDSTQCNTCKILYCCNKPHTLWLVRHFLSQLYDQSQAAVSVLLPFRRASQATDDWTKLGHSFHYTLLVAVSFKVVQDLQLFLQWRNSSKAKKTKTQKTLQNASLLNGQSQFHLPCLLAYEPRWPASSAAIYRYCKLFTVLHPELA